MCWTANGCSSCTAMVCCAGHSARTTRFAYCEHWILRAIVAGERNPHVLAGMRNVRIKASEEDIVQSLRGNWRDEHVFSLKQALELFDEYGKKVAECDELMEQQMIMLHQHDGVPGKARKHCGW